MSRSAKTAVDVELFAGGEPVSRLVPSVQTPPMAFCEVETCADAVPEVAPARVMTARAAGVTAAKGYVRRVWITSHSKADNHLDFGVICPGSGREFTAGQRCIVK